MVLDIFEVREVECGVVEGGTWFYCRSVECWMLGNMDVEGLRVEEMVVWVSELFWNKREGMEVEGSWCCWAGIHMSKR